MMGSITLLRTQTDDRLVALVRVGHERAFDAIVERYRRPLLRAARNVLPEARAEDAVQQAFLAAWRALRRGDEVQELRPWLYRIMRNTALNALRVQGYDHAELEDSLRVGDVAHDEVERRAVVRETLTGLAALPERQREALLRTAVEGRSQAEVAAAMGLTDGAVRQLVHRARHSLRAAMTAVTPGPVATWLAAGDRGPVGERVAELVAGAGGASVATTLAKVGTVAIVAGGAVAGNGLIEKRTGDTPAAKAAEVRPDRDRVVRDATTETARAAAAPTPAERTAERRLAGDGDGSRRTGGSDGSGDGDDGRDDDHEDSSGPGSGDDDDSSGGGDDFDDDHIDNSGPGSVNSGRDDDSSGSGGGGDDSGGDSSGPGSGDDDLVELSADDNSGSGSDSSGSSSDSSGSGSGDDEPDPVATIDPDDSSGPGSGSDDDR